jgi:DNA-binding transcriptional ArsR family regulator
MTRQAVTKHLVLLESAQLVASKKQGREKLHYLNPAPLHQISTRWIHKYANPSPIAGLKQPPARAMTALETEGDSRWTNLHVP